MTPVLEEIFRTGHCEAQDGSLIQVSSSISPEECRFLAGLLVGLEPGPLQTLEVGLAFGVSTLAICDALRSRPGSRHLAIDPCQTLARDGLWHGAGLRNLERAGLRELVEFHEASSQQVLPRLHAEGRQFDFVFIDGDHCFDSAFVDFYYADAIVRKGGLIVLDDLWMPAIQRLCRYIYTNRGYEVAAVHGATAGRTGHWARRVLRAVARSMGRGEAVLRAEVLHPEIDRALQLPCQAVAFRKTPMATRPWDFYRDF
jgi:predicted O-methyltransferase YrrM